MARKLSFSFLGTCCGGGPLQNRACSSSLIDVGGEALYMIDCAEGTTMQFMRSGVKMGRLTKIFITHMHSDHCLGVVPLLRNIMSGSGDTTRTDLRIELFGPSGLRKLIRTTLRITELKLNGKYAVHELLTPDDVPFPCQEADLHESEWPGRNVFCDSDGLWKEFVSTDGFDIDAAPISHRIKGLGYVFREAPQPGSIDATQYLDTLERNRQAILREYNLQHPMQFLNILRSSPQPITLPDGTIVNPPPQIPGRKLVILGDTHDPSAITELAMDASLLVHEATNAYMPPGIVKGPSGGSEALVRAKAISKGHSTAAMAGEFAKAINARRLVMNHFSTRFPPGNHWVSNNPTSAHRGPSNNAMYKTEPSKMLREIERQATQAWHDESCSNVGAYGRDRGKWQSAIAGWDYLRIDIESHVPDDDWQRELGNL